MNAAIEKKRSRGYVLPESRRIAYLRTVFSRDGVDLGEVRVDPMALRFDPDQQNREERMFLRMLREKGA